MKNDDMVLPKLGIVHTTQLHIKSRGNEEEQSVTLEKKDNNSLICFVIERDEIIGLKRFYFERNKTLDDLFKHFIKMEHITDDHKRRFRKYQYIYLALPIIDYFMKIIMVLLWRNLTLVRSWSG